MTVRMQSTVIASLWPKETRTWLSVGSSFWPVVNVMPCNASAVGTSTGLKASDG